ncbi:MAG: InlB B-repeat-containing protein [Spirochaetales bacterium]|nr:InlB B-repeat-containing protein [Spirochaetales bacterium]
MKKIIGFITMVMMVLGLFACETEQVGSAEVSEVTTTTIQYVIEFNGNGGNGSMESIVLKTAEKKAIPQNKFNAPLGKKFSHWNDVSDDSGSSYNEGKEVSDLSKVDGTIVTLYAIWIEKEAYSIIYRNTKGVNNPNKNSFKETDTIVLNNLSKSGWTFDGWYEVINDVTADKSISGWNVGQRFDDVILWAKWNGNTYTVTLYNDGDVSGDKTVTATFDSLMPLLQTKPSKTGWTFCGYWTEKKGQGTRYINGDGTGTAKWDLTNDTTLYAEWTVMTYTISYRDKDDAAFSGEWNGTPPATHIYNEETTLISPQRDGYRFDGWYLDSQCAGESVTVLAANDAAANITLYAKWTAGTSVITVDKQIITYDELELTIDYDDMLKQFTVSSPAATIEAENCTWYLDGETVLSESVTYSPDYDSLLGGHHSVTVMYWTGTDGYSAQTEFTMTKSY